MRAVSLLEFLNSAKDVCSLEYDECFHPADILSLINEDEQFVQRINFGIIYVHTKIQDKYTIIGGLSGIISLSLLLHAVCECYKKTSPRNDSAIRTIRSKYLLNNKRSKLRLKPAAQELYDKIINHERLSGREKDSKMFKLLHKFWSDIKENKLQAAHIFKMLQRVFVTIVDADEIPARELYYTLHKNSPDLNQLVLIQNYLKNLGIENAWTHILEIFNHRNDDVKLFLSDYFVTKYNFSNYKREHIYENFVNYFDTMLQYIPKETLISQIKRSAGYYRDILNINISNDELKQVLINIKLHNGDDTYAYILNVFEDYMDGNISEPIFLEILKTIDEYLKNRADSQNNIDFNELIQYLNAFITCK